MAADPIVVEATYGVPIARVWRAITSPAELSRWLFEPIETFRPEVGFETRFDVPVENRMFTHAWRVTEVVPESRLVYDWCYVGIPGESVVTWELFQAGIGSRLCLTHEGHETFPHDDEVFNRETGEAGWRYLLCESLQAFLDGCSDGR